MAQRRHPSCWEESPAGGPLPSGMRLPFASVEALERPLLFLFFLSLLCRFMEVLLEPELFHQQNFCGRHRQADGEENVLTKDELVRHRDHTPVQLRNT